MLTARIAWLGTICSGYALAYARHSDAPVASVFTTLEGLAQETGTPLQDLIALAEVRAQEFQGLLGIVLTAPDPTTHPPEPFAELLRYGQSDCQDLQQTRNHLEISQRSKRLPAASPPPTLRPELLPDPDLFYRAARVGLLLNAHLEELARGEAISPDLADTYAAFTNGAPLPEGMEPGMATRPEDLAYIAVRGPAPVVPDITEAELVQIVQHILDTPGGPYIAHYFDLFIHNTPSGARDLITGPFLNGQTAPTAQDIVAIARAN